MIPDNGDWSEANKPIGAQITDCYFAYNNRASIQVGCHADATSDPRVGIRINHNKFGTSGYTSETGQVAMQSCRGGDVSYNVFHDAASFDVGRTVYEEDFGARDWKVHHNVFYQGDSSVVMAPNGPVMMRGFGFSFSWFGGDSQMCFNNTVIDTCASGHNDWQYMTNGGTPNGTPWPVVINKNNLWAMSDTAPWHFANPRMREYSLTALSAKSIDKGVVIPGWVDNYEGSDPDLGAFEYGETPWVAGPDWSEEAWVYPPPTASETKPSDRHTGAATVRPIVRLRRNTILVGGLNDAEYIATVFNAAGAPVIARRGSGSRIISIDSAGLASGIYLVRIFCDGHALAEKVLVR